MELDIPMYQEGDQHCPAGQEGKPTTGMYAKVCGRYEDRKKLLAIFNRVKGQGGKVMSFFGPDIPTEDQFYKVSIVSPALVSVFLPAFQNNNSFLTLFVCVCAVHVDGRRMQASRAALSD